MGKNQVQRLKLVSNFNNPTYFPEKIAFNTNLDTTDI